MALWYKFKDVDDTFGSGVRRRRMALDELIARKQDELRGRPLNRKDHFVDWFKRVDWAALIFFISFTLAVTGWWIGELLKFLNTAGKCG